jgi:hypothetical protein
MARTRRIARKSTGRQLTGQLAPRNVPPQPELQPNSPQHVPQGEDSFEIVVMVPVGEDMQEAQQLPQTDDHDQREEDEDYTPWSNANKDETFHDTDEIKTFGDEAPTLPAY